MARSKSNTKKCFVVSPIGEVKSDTRDRSDKILRHVIKPVCEELGITPYRADEMNEPVLITRKIIKELLSADLVIADLTEHNPNVFYELAIRHFTGKPVIHIIENSERIPFDVFNFNTIRIDYKDMDSVERTKVILKEHILHAFQQDICENPVSCILLSLSIQLPIPKEQSHSLSEQFSDLCNRILEELKNAKHERNILFRKLLKHPEESPATDITIDQKAPVELSKFSGQWHSNYGPVRILLIDGNDVFATYTYIDEPWIGEGELVGKLFGNKIIFRWRWKDDTFKGIGYWTVSESSLVGIWWYHYELLLNKLDYHKGTFKYFLENLNKIDRIPLSTDEGRDWILRR